MPDLKIDVQENTENVTLRSKKITLQISKSNGVIQFLTYNNEVIAGYRDLTGHVPMYGKWAYGYWQSKEHYKKRDELLGIAHEYRKRKIPIDNIIQDRNYWDGRENWSQMFFDESKFPMPKEMFDIIHDLNFHMMISVWPGLGPDTPIYRDMEKRGYLCDKVGWAGFKYYDAFNPVANQLYWDYMRG